ncbi:SDR family oxidoreductase [Paragemmobacter straminiformis]|uniref:SDR family oxidoreductase n=1 Tax=Paragemmobacter straminiformis TaxID=2045119 RepID=A0A842I8G8_9RHOB|nr:SDR family oxidoreductase [Gemmobacter straminiformis]MBC2835929.1 SDR family oxidoreductase [Gemmobacter straminiformis]
MAHAFDGKVAAITGAASGIGLATTEALIAAGARVVLVDRDSKALDAVCARLGANAIPLVIDLLDPASCNTLLDGILSKAGQLDIFHANAGTYIGGDLSETTPETIDRMLNLNVNAVMKNVYTVMPHMIERGTGDIIVTSSVAGHSAIPWEPVYSASKWAMTCFVQTMRRQLNKKGIRVGSVSPGPVISALLADWPEENLRKAKESGSLIEPKEVADGIMFMLSRPRNVTIRDMVILPSNFDI